MNCININDKKYKELLEASKLPSLLLELRIAKWQENNNTDEFPKIEDIINSNEVNFTLKSIDILNSDKAKQIFEKGEKNNWDLNKILTELSIPKDQKQIILNLDKTKREDILIDLASKYSYTIEINLGQQASDQYEIYNEIEEYLSNLEFNRIQTEAGNLDKLLTGRDIVKPPKDFSVFNRNGTPQAYFDTKEEAQEHANQLNDTVGSEPSNTYSSLTVPGGVNYIENEIKTPNIIPSITGHADFSTDNGIGWFRSDEQENNNKIRRILELQSDLFQKARDYTYLTSANNIENGQSNRNSEELKASDFLQLLNKDNNWVTFFIKSIVQDSQKKDYEKVLFPTGNTVYKIEGGDDIDIEGDQVNEKLAPIMKFYDNQVLNNLNKQYGKSNINQITDEFGNTWNELTIDNSRDSKTILAKENKPNFNDLINENAKELINDRSQNNTINKVLFDDEQGKFTVDQILNNIINNYDNISDVGKELIQKASNLKFKSGANIKFVNESIFSGEDVVMDYDSDINTIRIARSRLAKYNVDTVVEVFIHEMVHAQTIKALLNPETFSEKDFKDSMNEAYMQYKLLSNSDSYGFTNTEEFVAELYANKEFADEIKNLDKSLWKKIIDAIRRLFGLGKKVSYDKLIEDIILQTESDQTLFKGIKGNRVFNKRVEDESTFTSLDSTLTNVINKAQDRIDNVIKRIESSINFKSSEDKIKQLEISKQLAEELETYESSKRWKAIIGYTQAFSNSINKVESLLNNLLLTKDITKDDLVETLGRYTDYLSSYDLLEDIKSLATKASINKLELSEEDQQDFGKIQDFLKDIEARHAEVKSKILEIQKAQTVKIFSNPIYNTEVETKQRKVLTKEYNALEDKGGLSLNEYITKNLSDRDNEDLGKDLTASAQKIVHNPSVDISFISSWLSDNINTNSRIVQIMNNIIIEARNKVIDSFRKGDHSLSKLYNTFIKEVGNKKPSELYKNIIEKDSEGKIYLKGEYSIKFKESFDKEALPIITDKKEFIKSKLSEGFTKDEIKQFPQYKAYNKSLSNWFKANTEKDINLVTGETITKPASKYLNSQPTGTEKEILDSFIKINNDNEPRFQGHGSLIRRIIGAEYHSIPTDYKSDLERQIEGDIKGVIKDKWTDLTEIKTGDIGIQSKEEAVDAKGNIIRHIKPLYRGKIDPKNQSLDLMTLFRKELFNGLDFESKTELKPTLGMIADVVKGKDFYKKSSKGEILKNKFMSRSPEVTVSGEFSELYKRILGLNERTLYNNFSNYGGTFLGKDINKISSSINGYAAGLAMSFNLASGVANAANGFTQLFIESVGNDKIKKGTVSKAEAKYTRELLNGNLINDLTSPNKTSYFNQLLEMFDVMGGLDLTEQESIRNTYMKKFASSKMMNFLNESGEHMMHSVLTEAIIDGIKVMNSEHRYIDKEGNITTKEKAASLSDMLYMDGSGILQMNSKVAFSDFNLTTNYFKGGKTHINALVKKKTFDIFGVYDVKFKNELSKNWLGKMTMMFKNFFISGAEYRYTGLQSALKKQSELTDEDLFYNSAEKEYIEGTYTTGIRFFTNAVIPALKSLQLMYIKENYNNLSEYEKSNLKKATLELALTSVILPSIGLILAGAAGDDKDQKLWFAIYINRRIMQELAQFRNPIEAGKMINNPIAGSRFVNNMLNFTYDILTPINFAPDKTDEFFGYLDEDSKGKNELVKHGKKLIPIWSQLDKKYQEMYKLQFGK